MASYESAPATSVTTNGGKPRAARATSAVASTVGALGKPRHDRVGEITASTARAHGKPRLERAAEITASTVDVYEKPRLSRSSDSSESFLSAGVVVPGDFRGVDVTVVDPDGKPLEEVEQLLAVDPFPTSAAIDENGEGTLPLLQTTYTAFLGLAKRAGSSNVGYTWFEGADNVIGSQDESAVIVLDPVEIKGLYAGRGTDMGGPLR